LRNCHYMNIMNSLMRRMNDRRLWHEKKGMWIAKISDRVTRKVVLFQWSLLFSRTRFKCQLITICWKVGFLGKVLGQSCGIGDLLVWERISERHWILL
jgi:hypothetical protein